MANTNDPTADPQVTDHTKRPSGVMNQGAKTWVMLAVALGLVALMTLSGATKPHEDPRGTGAERVPTATDPAVLADMQARLDAATTTAHQQPVQPTIVPDLSTRRDVSERDTAASTRTAAAPDTLAEERRRRQYESHFASSFSGGPRVGADTRNMASGRVNDHGDDVLDRTADAVIRASRRAAGGPPPDVMPPGVTPTPTPPVNLPHDGPAPPASTPPIDPNGPLHRLLEGTILDGVLKNQLDGSSAAPVNIQITNPIYSHRGDRILIPAGAVVIGIAKPVQNVGESRIAVDFHRLEFPDGSTVRLDGFKALNQTGDNGLNDKVNNHYATTFAVAGVVGLVTGLGQAIGNVGLGGSGSNRTTVIAGSVGNSTSQATSQALNRLANRLPTVTIRAGHRVKVYLSSDLELPAYPTR